MLSLSTITTDYGVLSGKGYHGCGHHGSSLNQPDDDKIRLHPQVTFYYSPHRSDTFQFPEYLERNYQIPHLFLYDSAASWIRRASGG
jgi:hypothetical protein